MGATTFYLLEKEREERAKRETEQGDKERQTTKAEQKEEITYPIHVGGGYFELSNGEKVRGKDEATEAENALKE